VLPVSALQALAGWEQPPVVCLLTPPRWNATAQAKKLGSGKPPSEIGKRTYGNGLQRDQQQANEDEQHRVSLWVAIGFIARPPTRVPNYEVTECSGTSIASKQPCSQTSSALADMSEGLFS
jgi:hypothetical protein